ncbi:MAG: exodeoxyribonuclease VII large subunit [Thermobacillus sp. ZCTH02-B1]|uniref:exodeoxyribonuclease VII large subunit n=1 Tax=Thermobacillus sp. ZCTH02-B1 TaxID=1858795 RepID=UPI000B56A512|nr:exodeoxyribonuclease VII large subunit [Thermobacillus sp. ZCTH02-B1]OUM96862.1 MAG: exodeoxyribonuclease VII large subunit [Thermobacillus sp. ZCTH02-B1]
MGEARIYSVHEITRYIRMKLESDERLADVWLRGEISNFTHHTSGHMYFTLKDEASRIKCVMFAAHNRKLPFMPRDGTKVIARGSVAVYERDGNYQFYVTQMQPDGIGSLYLAFEQLKRKLEAEGLFDPARKRPLPRYPRTIGVVTSPTGAAIRDILTTLGRRYPQARVVLVPVLVQGEGAAPSIVRAIELLNRIGEADVMIVGRGGGSIEELWAFNEEIVARAIAASRIPVISAVGHETDFTIADFAADLRAPTPTAAAELAVPHIMELKETLEHLKRSMRVALAAVVDSRRQRLARVRRSPVLLYPRRYLLAHAERLDRATERLRERMRHRAGQNRQRLLALRARLAAAHPGGKAAVAAARRREAERRLAAAMRTAVKDGRQRLALAMSRLDALSPLKVMMRGYSLVYDEREERLIRSIRDVQPGDMVKVRLLDGRLDCHIWSMRGEDGFGGNER